MASKHGRSGQSLPLSLAAAIEMKLQQAKATDLTKAALELSSLYRGPRNKSFSLSKEHCLAYLAVRLPATFAVATEVCAHLPQKASTLLDCGAGPGTLLWALSSLQHPLKQATLYEKERGFITLGQQLQSANENGAMHVDWHHKALQTQKSFPPHDLVSISYVLNELDALSQKQLVDQAWNAAIQAVVIIEPGTPQGFSTLLRARQQLIDQGATIYAPCPHNLQCPMQGTDDWCHFSVRLPRTPWHRRIKQAKLAYEDEKYCYLIAAKENTHETDARVIKRPLKGSGHISLDLCTPIGLKRSIVSKRTKTTYAQARNIVWGDSWNIGTWKDE